MRNNKSMIVQELEQSLNEQAPPTQPDTSGLHELPPLNIDGIPTPVDKMTQVRLRWNFKIYLYWYIFRKEKEKILLFFLDKHWFFSFIHIKTWIFNNMKIFIMVCDVIF